MTPPRTQPASDVGSRVIYTLFIALFVGFATYLRLEQWVQAAPAGTDAIGALLALCAALAGALVYVLLRDFLKAWSRTTFHHD